MKFSRLLQLALGLASLSPLGLPLSGQLLAVGTSDSIPIGKLETMNDALQIAAREPISDLLKRLGIDAEVAEAATSPRFSHDIEIQSLRTHSENSYGIVSLPCGLQGQAFIYLSIKRVQIPGTKSITLHLTASTGHRPTVCYRSLQAKTPSLCSTHT
jgi:hypothetical protein